MGIKVFILSHVYGEDDGNAKILGVFANEEMARRAVDRYLNLPGFRKHPSGFDVSAYELDYEYWSEGFGF